MTTRLPIISDPLNFRLGGRMVSPFPEGRLKVAGFSPSFSMTTPGFTRGNLLGCTEVIEVEEVIEPSMGEFAAFNRT